MRDVHRGRCARSHDRPRVGIRAGVPRRGAIRGDSGPDSARRRIGAARFHGAMDALLDAVHSPGRSSERWTHPFGPMPGGDVRSARGIRRVVHGWDLATSTGQAWDPPDDVVAEVDAFARQAITRRDPRRRHVRRRGTGAGGCDAAAAVGGVQRSAVPE